MIVLGIAIVLIGLALIGNVGGFAKWGAGSRWGKRDASGAIKQEAPVFMIRIVGVIPVIIGIAIIVHEVG